MVPSLVWLSSFGCPATSNPGTSSIPTGPTDPVVDTDTDSGTDPGSTTPTTSYVSNPSLSTLSWVLSEYVGSVVIVSWNQDAPATVHVEYSFDKDVWQSSPSLELQAGKHEQVIVGIPYDATAEWRVVDDATGSYAAGTPITTAPWPVLLPRPTLTVDDPTQQLPEGTYLLTSMNQEDGGWVGGTYWSIILDRQGRLIWAKRTPQRHWTLFAQVAVSGDHLLLDESTLWADFDNGAGSTIHRSYLDEQIEVIATPGLHHAFVQLPDETLAWGSQDHGGGEALVEKAPGQVDETVLWTCLDDSNFGSFCESNGLFYQESTNTYLYSFYTNSTLTEVDRTTGDSVWWAGEANGGYAFVPAGSAFFWQHGVSYTDSGTLLLSSEFGDPERTWLLEYDVDQTAGTLTLVWSDSSGVLAGTNGQAWRLANGNTLHVVGSASVIREVTAAGDDVWRLEWGSDYLLGNGQFITDLYALVSPSDAP